ncbi:hypothetical protein F5Y04DRAFT_278518 [Hypomontagnella monticulosa]|nr:hypothetical protein F5Y04DRAFT_278518 [Hypomontagnella monticulosa]
MSLEASLNNHRLTAGPLDSIDDQVDLLLDEHQANLSKEKEARFEREEDLREKAKKKCLHELKPIVGLEYLAVDEDEDEDDDEDDDECEDVWDGQDSRDDQSNWDDQYDDESYDDQCGFDDQDDYDDLNSCDLDGCDDPYGLEEWR